MSSQQISYSMDFNTNVLRLDVEYPVVKFEFDYEIDGKILVMPIRGHGPGSLQAGTYRVRAYQWR